MASSPRILHPDLDLDLDQLRPLDKLIGRHLLCLFNQASSSWPESIQGSIADQLANFYFCQDVDIAVNDPTNTTTYSALSDMDGKLIHEHVDFESWFLLAGIYGIDHPKLQPMRNIMEKKFFAPMTNDFKTPLVWDGEETKQSLLDEFAQLAETADSAMADCKRALRAIRDRDIDLEKEIQSDRYLQSVLSELKFEMRDCIEKLSWAKI